MPKLFYCLLFSGMTGLYCNGQDDGSYALANAVHIEKPEILSDSVYHLLNPYSIILFGEMHGTNESAPFVQGLADLFVRMGDSVQIGLELPPDQMKEFITHPSDSNIYRSDFFWGRQPLTGRETTAWAELIARLWKNPKMQVFFYDSNDKEGRIEQRDSIMAEKIAKQYREHPTRKMICLSGNYHNRIGAGPTMASFLLKAHDLKICSLNMEYVSGTALANFGQGLEMKQLGSYPSSFFTSVPWDHFLLLTPTKSNYPYNGFFFTRYISAASLTPHK